MDIVGRWRKAVSVVRRDDDRIFLCRHDADRGWIDLLYFHNNDDFDEFVEFLDSIEEMDEPGVLAKWRGAVSVKLKDNDSMSLHRFDKQQARWKQLLYFRTDEDFDEFVDFLDGVVEELGAGSSA